MGSLSRNPTSQLVNELSLYYKNQRLQSSDQICRFSFIQAFILSRTISATYLFCFLELSSQLFLIVEDKGVEPLTSRMQI